MVRGDLIGMFRGLRQGVLLVGALWALNVVAGCGGSGAQTAPDEACADAILDDWGENGEVDAAYEASCYLLAIDSLPQDVRAYTSAADDIFRALHARRPGADGDPGSTAAETSPPGVAARALSSAQPDPAVRATSSTFRLPPTPIVLLGALGLVAAVGAVAPTAVRRARRRP